MESGEIEEIPLVFIYISDDSKAEGADGAGESYTLDVNGVLGKSSNHPSMAPFIIAPTEYPANMIEEQRKKLREQSAIALGRFVRSITHHVK